MRNNEKQSVYESVEEILERVCWLYQIQIDGWRWRGGVRFGLFGFRLETFSRKESCVGKGTELRQFRIEQVS